MPIQRVCFFHGAIPAIFMAVLVLISGCGGGSSTPTPTASVTTPVPTGPTPSTSAGAISVAGGQTVSGVDINVVSPAASPAENAELLGVTGVNTGGSASNSGATIHQGSTMKVLLFGQGLSGSMTVSISGPGDIAVSNIVSISSTSGTPGIAFSAAVSASAGLGARTVFLKSANGDITTFTGGLEVIP